MEFLLLKVIIQLSIRDLNCEAVERLTNPNGVYRKIPSQLNLQLLMLRKLSL